MPHRSQTSSSPDEDANRVRSITDVLCREVGASHPDGALKQIRTMKRLLRSHYRVQQRLEQYDVDSLDEAVSHIASLTQTVEQIRTQQHRRARRRLTIIESLLDQMSAVCDRTAPSSDVDAGPGPLQDALDLVDALATELNELRLELWVYHTNDPETDEHAAGATATDLITRLDDALRDAQETVAQLRRERDTLQDANDQLRDETERLRRTVEQQQRRIERLEEAATQPPHLSTPDS